MVHPRFGGDNNSSKCRILGSDTERLEFMIFERSVKIFFGTNSLSLPNNRLAASIKASFLGRGSARFGHRRQHCRSSHRCCYPRNNLTSQHAHQPRGKPGESGHCAAKVAVQANVITSPRVSFKVRATSTAESIVRATTEKV